MGKAKGNQPPPELEETQRQPLELLEKTGPAHTLIWASGLQNCEFLLL
jgi:hypothetical protein